MLKSMTGYGKGEFKNVRVEIKTLNHRFCEITVKLPPFLLSFEEEIKKIVKKTVKRGRIDIFINLPNEKKLLSCENLTKIDIDKNMVYLYKKAGDKLSKMLNKKNDLKLDFFINLPGVLKIKQEETNKDKIFENVRSSLIKALKKMESMRMREGRTIRDDFCTRIKKIDFYINQIKICLPELIKNFERRLLTTDLEEFLKDPKRKNEKKIITSAINAERMEITEEIVRFKSHIDQFLKTTKKGDEVGKTLEFIIQEMHREINTLGSKVNNYEISDKVIQIKSELEKLKEQVQNVE